MLQEVFFKPESSWVPPKSFPALPTGPVAIDLETYDPGLKARGPGGMRKEGYVVGVAMSCDAWTHYFPIRHTGGGNLDAREVQRFTQAVCNKAECVIFANAQYDIEWLREGMGVYISVPIQDIQINEPLLNEELRSYSLENLAQSYLGKGKSESLLLRAAQAYGIDPKGGLGDLHSKYVGGYAEDDARLTLEVWRLQMELIHSRGLNQIHQLESDLIPVLARMRERGVRIDLGRADALGRSMLEVERDLRQRGRREFGAEIDEWSGPMLARYCTDHGIRFPSTGKGNASFAGSFLEHSTHPFLVLVSDIREVNRLRKVYVEDLTKHQVKGRIHTSWNQLRAEKGTRTGRMSASDPNLQQIPKGKGKWGPQIRALFIPEEGHKWAKLDYSQQEPRLAVHFGCVMGSKSALAAAESYRLGIDFYDFVKNAAKVERDQAKQITLGRMYGMGAAKLAVQLNVSEDEALELLRRFDEQAPFVKELSDEVQKTANKRGYIRTILKRHRHFDYWAPDRDEQPLPRVEAEAKWPGKPLQRCWLHKALNSLIQGSAADMTKQALWDIYCETKTVPYLQVHDELGYGVTEERTGARIQELMTNAVPLKVPMKVDMKIGEHWQ